MIEQESSPLLNVKDSIEWLENQGLPKAVYNPLIHLKTAPRDPIDNFVYHLTNIDYLHFAANLLLEVRLLPFQCVILDTLWTKRLPIIIASRGASKSYTLAVYNLLKMILVPDTKIVITGNGLRQARQIFDYMDTIWHKSPILRDIAGRGKSAGPRREVDRFQFEIGNSRCWAIPLGTGETIRGMRATVVEADEFGSTSEEIFNLVVQGFAVVESSPERKVMERDKNERLKKIGLWTPELDALQKKIVLGNQIVTTGTANYSFNHFARRTEQWSKIIKSKGDINKLKEIFGEESEKFLKGFDWKDCALIRLPYTHLPDGWLSDTILAQAKATLSTTQFNMEYCALHQRDSDGFYKMSIIEQASCNKPISLNGRMIQFHALRHGKKDRKYVMGVDPAADADNAAIVVLELHQDHRRVVNCWITNKKKYADFKKKMLQQGQEVDDEYYRYIARKIKNLMSAFDIERIIMDKHGGGTAIAEALGSRLGLKAGDHPVYEVPDRNNPKPSDMEEGIHILELLSPSNEINSDANHGMLKDLQEKVLLFPLFDTIEVERSYQIDKENKISFDTYEDNAQEIEEIKNEMTTVVVTDSNSGKQVFDTPKIKMEGSKKGRLRKDRYSALLYANWYSRNREKKEIMTIEYRAVGGTKDNLIINAEKSTDNMYYGPGMLKMKGSRNPYTPMIVSKN